MAVDRAPFHNLTWQGNLLTAVTSVIVVTALPVNGLLAG